MPKVIPDFGSSNPMGTLLFLNKIVFAISYKKAKNNNELLLIRYIKNTKLFGIELHHQSLQGLNVNFMLQRK